MRLSKRVKKSARQRGADLLGIVSIHRLEEITYFGVYSLMGYANINFAHARSIDCLHRRFT